MQIIQHKPLLSILTDTSGTYVLGTSDQTVLVTVLNSGNYPQIPPSIIFSLKSVMNYTCFVQMYVFLCLVCPCLQVLCYNFRHKSRTLWSSNFPLYALYNKIKAFHPCEELVHSGLCFKKNGRVGSNIVGFP